MSSLILCAVFTPVLGAFFLPLIGKHSKASRNITALVLILISFFASLLLLKSVLAGQVLSFGVFSADPLAVYMALVSSFIGAVIVLYSFDYISHYENQNEYYLMVVLFLGSMMGLVYAKNLIALYVFWEITAIACWRLIGFYRYPVDIIRADKAFLVTFFGAVVMLLAFIGIYQQFGTFDLAALQGTALPDLFVALILFGILSKSATLPFHTWLPDAGVAPSPVTALLHAAVLVKIGVYVFARLFIATFTLGAFWHTVVPVIAATSALVSAGAAMIDTDMKRIIAYSTISQIGFIFLGLATGNAVGMVGGLLYILMHGLAKGGLFLCAGIVEQNTHTKDITRMGGLIKTMPFTAIAFLFCAFSVMGIPPFGGFFSKYLVISGAFNSGQVLIALTFIIGAVLTILYLFRLFKMIFLGEAKGDLAKEGSGRMVFCVSLLAALSLAGGLLVNFPLSYLQAMFGNPALGMAVLFRFDPFSLFILGSILFFALLILIYALVFMRGKPSCGQFYLYYLLTVVMAGGAVLAGNLILFFFFWEGLLLTLFGMIYIGGKGSFKTAIKAFVLVGIADLCLMAGVALTGHLAGTFTMAAISLPLTGLGGLAFILLMIGAIGKAGAMPFHSWIPDAALDAPLPFMALVPGALEKLIGIYFLTRISLDMFKLSPDTWASTLLMVIGALTIILAVMMALVQKDYKRLLSYHAISQVGYMVLGIGTAVPAGIVGGLFHMLNNALYKSCLFLSGGAVEKEAGTTDLGKLGGLAAKMPVTFACFLIAALSISGVPPFNGFFSKELVYDGALERGWIFYAVALLGSFFTAASFLKLGHAVYLGKAKGEAREAPWPILLPMIIIAALCILFGVNNALPIKNFIQPILGEHLLEGHNYWGLPPNLWLVAATVAVLALALLNHLYGVKKSGQGLGAVDHIHYAPVLKGIYARAEKRYFDPYDIGLRWAGFFSRVLYRVDRFFDWIYDGFIAQTALFFSYLIRRAHTGNLSVYMLWSIVGAFAVVMYMLRF